MESMFRVGVIVAPHGLKGEVKVFPTTENKDRFKRLKKVLMEEVGQFKELHIESVKFVNKFVVLKFKEMGRIEDVEKLRSRDIFVERGQAIPLGEHENYIADLIDMEVLLEDDSLLGRLTEVIQTGANDVYVVERADKSSGNKEILIPAIRSCILDVNVAEKVMKVHLMEGLDQ